MKPFYTQDVLVEAKREELLKIRYALSFWMTQHTDWKTNEDDENRKVFNEMMELYEDVTKVVLSLPF